MNKSKKINERERERMKNLFFFEMPLLVLEGAFYRLSNGLSLLPLMERVMKNNKVVS